MQPCNFGKAQNGHLFDQGGQVPFPSHHKSVLHFVRALFGKSQIHSSVFGRAYVEAAKLHNYIQSCMHVYIYNQILSSNCWGSWACQDSCYTSLVSCIPYQALLHPSIKNNSGIKICRVHLLESTWPPSLCRPTGNPSGLSSAQVSASKAPKEVLACRLGTKNGMVGYSEGIQGYYFLNISPSINIQICYWNTIYQHVLQRCGSLKDDSARNSLTTGMSTHPFSSSTTLIINTPGRWFHSTLGIPTPQERYSMWPPALALHVRWRKAFSIQWTNVYTDQVNELSLQRMETNNLNNVSFYNNCFCLRRFYEEPSLLYIDFPTIWSVSFPQSTIAASRPKFQVTYHETYSIDIFYMACSDGFKRNSSWETMDNIAI